MTPEGYVEGERSLVADKGPMRFHEYPSDVRALAQVFEYPSVQRLEWFNHGFMKAQQHDGQLVLSDLRMGAEPDYSFRFAVAQLDGGIWREIPPRQLEWPWQASRRLAAMWDRIWTQPADAQAQPGARRPLDAASASDVDAKRGQRGIGHANAGH